MIVVNFIALRIRIGRDSMIIKEKKYGLWSILGIPFECAPVLTVFLSILTLLDGIVPTIQVMVTAQFIDTAVSIVKGKASVGMIYPALWSIVALIAYTWISEILEKFAQVRMEIAIREKFRTAVTEKRAKLLYRHIENQESWDLIRRVSKDPEVLMKTAFMNFMNITSNIIKVAGILILLITQVWWAALMILAFSIPLFALAVKSGKANYETNREVTKYQRRYEYLSEVLTGREAVDERSLFGYSKELGRKWYEKYEKARKIVFRTSMKWFIKMKAGSIITAIISILIVLVLLKPVLSGIITVGMFISLVNAVFGLVQVMSWGLTDSVDKLAEHIEYMNDLTKFAALEEEKDVMDKPLDIPAVFESLEFKDVRFKYPGSSNYILNGVSFKMESGRHYAFVGSNGAGKTTITKLITGLYNNFEGQILINDKDIREYTQRELKSFFSVVYQDFAKYYITMKDNIKLGNINEMNDKKVDSSIHDAAKIVNLSKAIEKLQKGINTPLGKIKEDGQDVSGGEWQRIAMARAFISPAPMRILDEPTAALDPISESRLYEEFGKISKNKTSIFISHRLGSTKLADEIFVIGDGKIVEKGTHKELMDINGVYSEMYDSQRSWYIDEEQANNLA